MNKNPTNLHDPLKALDMRLCSVNKRFKLVVVGAFALNLLNISGQYTADIDSVCLIDDPIVRKIIEDIATEYRLPKEWINDAASTIDLPVGFFERIQRIPGYTNIDLYTGSRVDMIALKARAYLHRGEIETKDIEDLMRLKPTKKEIESAIEFIRLTSTPPEADLFPEFETVIEEIRNVAT